MSPGERFAPVRPVRTLVVWCPDWPVVAAVRSGDVGPDFDGIAAADRPIAVMRANRVVATSAVARAGGIRRGMRRREAQSRIGAVELVADDPSRDARWFESVVAAIDRFTPLIEVVRPGLCQFATRGPSRYFGGDEALIEQIRTAVSGLGVALRIGVADGPFTAALAARSRGAHDHGHHVVAPDGSPEFLADHPISALISAGAERMGDARAHRRAGRAGLNHPDEVSELVDLLTRLGLSTLGSVAAIERTDMLARFGPVGVTAHRLCSGDDEAPLEPTPIPPDLTASIELDPPIDRVEAAAFVAKGLAEELHERLGYHGLACTRVRIEARTDTGVDIVRLWRHERAGAAGGLTAQGLADRVRWQLDGWLRRLADATHATALDQRADDPSTYDPGDEWNSRGRCIVRVTLAPDEVQPDRGRQLGLWGTSGDAEDRAARVFTRLQGMLGPDAVRVPLLSGGRAPNEQVRLVPWGDERGEQLRDGLEPSSERPWPGQVPPPLPTMVHQPPLPADLRTLDGWPVAVSGRGLIDGDPARLSIASSIMGSLGQAERLASWAGPWPVEERWWDVQAARRHARMQVVTEDGRAYLLLVEGGQWWVEATYD